MHGRLERSSLFVSRCRPHSGGLCSVTKTTWVWFRELRAVLFRASKPLVTLNPFRRRLPGYSSALKHRESCSMPSGRGPGRWTTPPPAPCILKRWRELHGDGRPPAPGSPRPPERAGRRCRSPVEPEQLPGPRSPRRPGARLRKIGSPGIVSWEVRMPQPARPSPPASSASMSPRPASMSPSAPPRGPPPLLDSA